MSTKKTINVLMVDQAITFGGSIVVMANIANNVTSNVKCSIIYEVPHSVADYLFHPDVRKRKISNVLNYYVTGNIKDWIKSLNKNIVRKVLFKTFVFATILSSWLQILRISRVILQDRIDIVHSNNSAEAIFAAKMLGRKTVAHLHGPGAFDKELFVNKVDRFIAISDFVKHLVLVCGHEEDKVIVIPNPVLDKKPDNAQVEKYRNQFGISNTEKVFGIVGRIVEWKGQLEFIEAVNLAVKNIDNVKVLIVGDISDGNEAYLDKVKAKIAEYNLQEKIVITGYIEDVHNAVALLDLLVHCSTDPEPFGLVITEAMIMKIPVIAANIGAPLEIIEEGKTGYLVDPHDAKKLSKRITDILGDDEHAKNMGVAARETAIKKYNIETYISKLNSVYFDVLK